MVLVGLYFTYRVLYLGISKHRTKHDELVSGNNLQLSTFSVKRVVSWSILGFIGGLGLAAFFILPAYEFIENATLAHDVGSGLFFDNPPQFISNIYSVYFWSNAQLLEFNHAGWYNKLG